MQTGSHCLKSVNNQLIILLDGNFQHQHQKAAGRNYAALVTPDIFIQPSNLDEMKEYILLQEALHKVPNKVCNASLFIYGWLYADASTASILIKRDKCTESHKAANDSRSDTTWKGCDDTGLMGSCCRHYSVIYMLNIHASGENRALPLTILKRIMGNVDPD
ncbi:hypothetical protein PCASD_12607 [Puccinia coronata f. sp. avenae]|uniref:Uncharacterized protein n=1 Tax=Puccinia coronata f. sp. avenae TaxID=200324 RepID=A0A2N5TE24_9BASI|nr:hypothetical protein PCASD_12607 [Puccinia coronata f. sp. avenae]